MSKLDTLELRLRIKKEAERQINEWLSESTEKEKQHYRVAFRRGYEYLIRILKETKDE